MSLRQLRNESKLHYFFRMFTMNSLQPTSQDKKSSIVTSNKIYSTLIKNNIDNIKLLFLISIIVFFISFIISFLYFDSLLF